MPKRPSKPRPRDVARIALDALEQTTGEQVRTPKPPKPERPKNPAAVALGKLGGAKGGKARAASLTKKQLSAIGKKGARKRWGD